MLQHFDAEPLASALLVSLRRFPLRSPNPASALNKNIPHMSLLCEAMRILNPTTNNSLHLELMTVKSLLLLRRRGHLEFVSFTKTKITNGLVSTAPGWFARRFDLRDSTRQRVEGLVYPSRWIKSGDPIW